MRLACRYCIADKGLRLSSPWIFASEEELFNHIEMMHDLVVIRGGETDDEAFSRVKAKNPRIGIDDCQCPSCKAKRGDFRNILVNELMKGIT